MFAHSLGQKNSLGDEFLAQVDVLRRRWVLERITECSIRRGICDSGFFWEAKANEVPHICCLLQMWVFIAAQPKLSLGDCYFAAATDATLMVSPLTVPVTVA